MLKQSFKTGASFGLTSGIITTLGLIVGLHAGTHSRLAIIGGILTIAIADAFSDALGIHIAQESQTGHSTREIWEATIATFGTKFVFALTFVLPIVMLPIQSAVLFSVVWGLLLLAAFNVYLARAQHQRPWGMILEHLLIALAVITITHYLGHWSARPHVATGLVGWPGSCPATQQVPVRLVAPRHPRLCPSRGCAYWHRADGASLGPLSRFWHVRGDLCALAA